MKNQIRNNRKTAIVALSAVFLLVGLTFLRFTVLAEQLPGTPNSGVDSRIKAAYDSLSSLSHGSDGAGGWGDWGAYWNRIRSAAEWVPNGGTAIASDVGAGKTFYLNSRTPATGTAQVVNYSEQQYVAYDDYEDPDYMGEESVWTNTSTNVWKDTRTGLYWSNNIGSFTNIFPNQDHSSCDFFSSDPRGSYNGLDAQCGNAINACGTLSLDRNGDATPEIDWYLPTQKELMQAYLDGMYNQAGAGGVFTTTSNFCSSTELSDAPTHAWNVYLYGGNTNPITKVSSMPVRCVSRDL